MMKDKKELAKLIYEEFKKEDVNSILIFISNELKEKTTPFVGSIGKEVGKIIVKENDKDVKKAIGWALREITKKDQKSVFEFLQKWTKAEDKNTKWIIKDGMKKLSEEQQEELKSLLGE